METSRQLTLDSLNPSTSSWADSHVKTYPWLETVRDWLEAGAPCSGSSPESQRFFDLHGCLSRMSLDSSVATLVEISTRSSTRWMNSGMVWRGGCLTLRLSEFPNDAVASSLSDVLEGHVHPKYSLSQKAAAGILRRAEKRGRVLPTHLEDALTAVAEMGHTKTSSSPIHCSPSPTVPSTIPLKPTSQPPSKSGHKTAEQCQPLSAKNRMLDG